MKKAVYSGSFNPFTYGHLNIVKQACKLFDEVTIIIAINSEKKYQYSQILMQKAIEDTLKEYKLWNCTVLYYDGLIAKYCKEHDIHYLVRGLRNNMDYNYEENIAMINEEINPNLMSIYFRSEKAVISSSMVRELLKYNEDVSKYVPNPILFLLKNENKQNK